MTKGIIFDIQRFSVHDGEGIRTLVFLKGCPLRCLWCSNPESQRPNPELLLLSARCIGCGRCLDACQEGAVTRGPEGALLTDRARCRECGGCAEACPANARELRGRLVTVDDVMREVERDAVFYRASGGGVTLSGGEPLLQPEFATEILRRSRWLGMDTAVETCGQVPWANFAAVLPYLDAVLFDIKHVDSMAHRRLTGMGNEQILANLRGVVSSGVPVVVRVPLVPGANADEATIAGIAALTAELGLAELHLLPYHRLGESKYRALGRGYPYDGAEPLSEDDVQRLAGVVQSKGLRVKIGG